MENRKYPALVMDRDALTENVRILAEDCGRQGIEIAGIIKGAGGWVEATKTIVEGGATLIGSSRLEQLARCREAGIEVPLMMIRVPMLSELPELIRVADIALVSERATLDAIERQASLQDKEFKVILMADLGDLREGWWDKDEMLQTALYVEEELAHVTLAGIGTNLGCYGSVMPTEDKMQELADLAAKIEINIGRELEYVSGGASSSLLAVYRGYMPEKINMLRIGAVSLIGDLEDVRVCYDLEEIDRLGRPFTLQAQVVEVKDKPTHPVGTLGVDAFGKKGVYEDRGIRRRALIAIGRADYGDIADLVPTRKGIEIIGASGDHTILDVEAVKDHIEVGDILTFNLRYSALLYLSSSENVKKYVK